MATVYKYQFKCEIDGWQTGLSELPFDQYVPTCSVNSSHTIVAGSNGIIETISENMPIDQYSRIRVSSTSKRNPKSWTQYSTCGDTASLYAGEALAVSCTTEVSKVSGAAQFRDITELHYGIMHFKGALFGDKASFGFYATGNTVVDGSDHLALVPTGLGFNVIVYNPAGTKSISGNVIPVDSVTPKTWEPTGYWNKVGEGYTLADFEFCPNGDGYFNLYDTTIPLMNIGTNVWLLGDGHLDFMNEDAALIHPGWFCTLTLYNSDINRTTPLQAVLMLKTNREKTK